MILKFYLSKYFKNIYFLNVPILHDFCSIDTFLKEVRKWDPSKHSHIHVQIVYNRYVRILAHIEDKKLIFLMTYMEHTIIIIYDMQIYTK